MYGTLKIVWSVVAACLVVLILLHSPKSDGLGGFSGQAQLFSSTKSAETALNRVTWFLTVLFLGLTIVLSGGWFAAPVVTSPAQVVPATPSTPNAAPIPLDLPSPTAPTVTPEAP
ncbi:preprotein translocase subunit SecG [Pseudanabaena sp. FACHB-1277]|jgi:preprotein translocase subunit SecG|uniref:Protein-export membrane protein SecG n=1 Tax=Pseudanabaena cinerea FACHB-1277 TaxID=2949581 RepID=A0A926UR50_9CYAN|nr:preprotein translocase subunit SecG [Pseudanabaena cinerea]MBD2149266.1 preprotein translocase subunit SecG [Pseudanabaena cinerea FACHB-1277]